ncbi:DUF1064 domain-containing protein [Paenibacillus periandrae]|uniref:DUF1064 domain-containing protein n=1 Tax=Paenibacillus periandrae TaxID=1761741 RepID=UPI001F08FA1D
MTEEKVKTKYNASKAILYITKNVIVKVTAAELKKLKETGLIDAVVFDSELEAKFYRDILLPEVQRGLITVEMQPKFTLLPKLEKGGIKHQPITYSPDFKITYIASGKVRFIDVKGMEDQKFPIKRKMFDAAFPEFPPLVVMKHVKKFGGWITIEEYTKKKREEDKLKKSS